MKRAFSQIPMEKKSVLFLREKIIGRIHKYVEYKKFVQILW